MKKKIPPVYAVSFFVLIYIIGLVGLIYDPTRELFKSLVPVNLLFSFAGILIYHSKWSKTFILAAGLIALTGFIAEVAGVQSGLIFGEYKYGPTLGLKFMNVPLIIGINWLILVYGVAALWVNTKINVLLKSFFGALLMVFYDFVMEPVAIYLDFWHWKSVQVPVQNYLAWFFLSFIFVLFFFRMNVTTKNPLAIALFFIQLCFFIVLNVFFIL